MKNTFKFIAVLAIATLTLASCNKSGRTAQMNIHMKDAPGDFQEVNIEVLAVEINHRRGGWITLDTKSGIYDLLKLQDGVLADLVEDEDIPVGKIGQMRLVLGSDNEVMVDSVYFDLATPSAQQSGLKFNLDQEFKAKTEYDILIDFDAEKSIVIQGNGSYSLKPNIKVISVDKR